MVDSVILAAVDVVAGYADSPLRERSALLDILRAAIWRARRLGLTLEEVDALLSRPSAAPPAEPSRRSRRRQRARNRDEIPFAPHESPQLIGREGRRDPVHRQRDDARA